MPRIFIHRFVVGQEDVDELGHVNNQRYIGWMQDAATAHSDAQGWPGARYAETGTAWVVRSHAITYRRPAFAGDALLLATWVAGFSPRSSPRRYLFRRPADRRTIAEAETVWAFVDRATGQPRRVPEALRDAFDIVAADDPELLALTGG